MITNNYRCRWCDRNDRPLNEISSKRMGMEKTHGKVIILCDDCVLEVIGNILDPEPGSDWVSSIGRKKKTKRLLIKVIYLDAVINEIIAGVTNWNIDDGGGLTVMCGAFRSYFPKESFVYVTERAEKDDESADDN